MSLHDRDYVREKDFNYKKMQYQNSSSKKSSNTNYDSNFKKIENFDYIHYIVYPFSFYVLGFFLYFFIALQSGGQNLSLVSNLILFHFFYFIGLIYHIRYR